MRTASGRGTFSGRHGGGVGEWPPLDVDELPGGWRMAAVESGILIREHVFPACGGTENAVLDGMAY